MKEVIGVAIGILIFLLVLSPFVVGINYIKSYKCESTAKALGISSEYSWSTGCILVKQDGTKTPLYLQRFVN